MYTSTRRENLDVSYQEIGPIVDEAVHFVRLHDPRREVTLINECPKHLAISAERTLLFRVLFNLTLNAVRALKYANQPRTRQPATQKQPQHHRGWPRGYFAAAFANKGCEQPFLPTASGPPLAGAIQQ